MSQYGSSIGNLIGQNGQTGTRIMAQGQTGADLFGQFGQLFWPVQRTAELVAVATNAGRLETITRTAAAGLLLENLTVA